MDPAKHKKPRKKLKKKTRVSKKEKDLGQSFGIMHIGGVGVTGKSPKNEVKKYPQYDYEDERACFDHLPDEIIRIIFTFLDQPSLGSCANVCTRWVDLVRDPQYWNSIVLSRIKGPLNASHGRAIMRLSPTILDLSNPVGTYCAEALHQMIIHPLATKLTRLTLCENEPVTSIKNIAKMKKLRYLNLNGMELYDDEIEPLFSLTRLTSLNLSNIYDISPVTAKKLPELRQLRDLSCRNTYFDTFPFTKLSSSLTSLHLSYFILDSCTNLIQISALTNLSNLSVLDGDDIDRDHMDSIGKLVNLKRLNIARSRIIGEVTNDPVAFEEYERPFLMLTALTNLEYLNLSEHGWDHLPAWMPFLTGLTKLRTLEMKSKLLSTPTIHHFSAIQSLPGLTYLDIQSLKCDDDPKGEWLTALVALTSLNLLNAHYITLTTTALDSILSLPHLQTLFISLNAPKDPKTLHDDGFKDYEWSALESATQLQFLHINSAVGLNSSFMQSLRYLTDLEDLQLNEVLTYTTLSDSEFSLVCTLTKLSSLHFRDTYFFGSGKCCPLTSNRVRSFAIMPHMKRLNLGRHSSECNITEDTFKWLKTLSLKCNIRHDVLPTATTFSDLKM